MFITGLKLLKIVTDNMHSSGPILVTALELDGHNEIIYFYGEGGLGRPESYKMTNSSHTWFSRPKERVKIVQKVKEAAGTMAGTVRDNV